jgi:MGT family glycosyltransferase
VSGHFAIFVYSGFGHLLPTVEVARELIARGHRVTYVAEERYEAMLARTGARIVGYPSGAWQFGQADVLSADAMAEANLTFLHRAVDTVIPLAREVFADDLPDVVLYDLQSAVVARTLAAEWDRPRVQLFPYLTSNEHYSFHARVFDFDAAMMERTFAVLGELLPDADPWDLLAEFDDRNLVFLPRRFQPLGDTFDDRFTFVGPCLATPDAGSWPGPPAGKPVVLVSLGTTKNDRPEFFRLCAEAFADGRWHVVMTLGPGNSVTGAEASNIETHQWLDHSTVLPRADAFVCAGGMGSLQEAFSFGTPVVVVPHTAENAVNAKQVVELGIGLTMRHDELSPAALRAAVEHVAADPGVRERSDELRRDIASAGGAVRAADMLQDCLALSL